MKEVTDADVADTFTKDQESSTTCTTNATDLAEAAKLQARLSAQQSSSASTSPNNTFDHDAIPTVSIDEGANKYVLITACTPGNSSSSSRKQTFVYSKQGANYHRNVAEYLIPLLEGAGYYEIRITGGGRIFRSTKNKTVNIFGYSYGFGRADHQLAVECLEESGLFEGYTLNWSNDGY